MLFRLPAETARRITLELLALQARLPGGPALFAAMARAQVPDQLRIRFVGLDFASPVGLAAGIDVDGRAAVLMQKLGFGFLELGPLGVFATSGCRETSPVLLHDVHGLVLHASRGAAAADEVLDRLPQLDVPIGVEVRGEDLLGAVRCAEQRASYITLPGEAATSPELLRELRLATGRPLLIKLSASWEDARLSRLVAHAAGAGIHGACVVASTPSRVHAEGEEISSAALARALEVIEGVRARMPVALSGGVLTPADAAAASAAGAQLIALSNGFVFAGPGLPQRINRRLQGAASAAAAEATSAPPLPVRPSSAVSRSATIGRALLLVSAAAILLIGIGNVVLALTARLLPNDIDYLGMSVAQLCPTDDCRLAQFISHNCAAYGGISLANGVMWTWLARGPLRRGEPWAWWALLFAAGAVTAGFLSFVGYGYFDVVHSAVVLGMLACTASGLWLTRGVAGPGSLRAELRSGWRRAWTWSPAGRGRLLLLGLALGLVLGGSVIVAIALTRVFVPEDVDFIRLSAAQVHAITPRLMPVMAHDRAEFGAGLLTFGILVAAAAWNGMRPGARAAWVVLALAAMLHFTATFVAHALIGYRSFVHLFPVYWGVTVLWLGLLLLYRPVWHADGTRETFPEL